MADEKSTPEQRVKSPQGIKQPAAVGIADPKAPRATKMRKEIRIMAAALAGIVLLTIVMGVLRHGAKQKQAAAGSPTTDKPVQSAAGAAGKLTEGLENKARRDKAGVLGQQDAIRSSSAGQDILDQQGKVPPGDVAGELNLPPTRIAQQQRPGSGPYAPPPSGPRQLTAAELRRQQEEAEDLAARNSSLSKGGSSRAGGPVPPASPTEALAQLANTLSRGGGQQPQATGGGAGGPASGRADDQNEQGDKVAFLENSRKPSNDPNFARVSRETSVSRYEVKAGWDIPATLEQGMNSDLPGDVRGIVRENVYDTATGRYLLIPQGSRVIGFYNSRVAYGQRGLQVVWTRLIYPDGSSIDLGGLNGEDVQGLSGFRDKVNNHYGKLLAIAALSSVFAAGVELSQRQNTGSAGLYGEPTINQTISASVGQQIGQLGTTLAERQLNVQPTITIPIGYRFNIRVRKDLIFDAPYAERQALWK